jgi:copper(I)-binding protein
VEFAAMAAKAPVKVGTLVIDAPWARATPPGVTVGGGFLRITNEGSEPDRLLGGQAAFADHVEIHETSMVDAVMRMRQLTEGLEIKPGQTVEFKPGSYHVMFVGVKEPLKQGSQVKVTFDFEKAGKVEIEFDVVGVGAGAPQGMHMH